MPIGGSFATGAKTTTSMASVADSLPSARHAGTRMFSTKDNGNWIKAGSERQSSWYCSHQAHFPFTEFASLLTSKKLEDDAKDTPQYLRSRCTFG
jgi:hypothetical protein